MHDINKMALGPTSDLHEQSMAYLWGPVINVAIFLALYSYRPYAILLHGLITLFVGVFSLAISLTILYNAGFPQPTAKLYNHFNIGFAAMLCIILQLLMGMALKLINVFDFSSALILKLSYAHKIFGYLMVLLCKANYYVIFQIRAEWDQFWGYLGMDLAIILAVVLRKLLFPKL